jgi:hypothetical protein
MSPSARNIMPKPDPGTYGVGQYLERLVYCVDADERPVKPRQSAHERPARRFRMPHVQSSMITKVEYDEDTGELDITFTSGKTYRYLRVPLEIYVDLLDAKSKGGYFNDCIKDEFVGAEVTSRPPR